MLKNKVAIVTGGTRGIGFAIVKKYLENGATVVLCGSKQETADIAVKKLKDENADCKVEGIGLNLNSPEEIKKAFENIKTKYGRLDILVNNAGISARESIYEYDPVNFEKIIDLNVNSVFYCTQAAVKIMKEQGGGSIINTSSMVSFYGQTSGCGYPASKFAINGLTKSLARELGRDNIRVNAVAPGITNTDMVAALPDEIIKPLIATIPLGRVGEPEDVANAFLFLASDMSSYVTGAVLPVDGAARS
ncbi:MAG TPA: 3-oxoacyl-ACP reductase family protein [Sedimentibacter sp.]|nr:3-oxoacyl-ACP reductase family protein [Sedimentibacter sp.]